MLKRILCLSFGTLLLTGGARAAAQTEVAIGWIDGPATVDVGTNLAELALGAGYRFAPEKDMATLMELTQNIPDGNEVGAIIPTSEDEDWWMVFSYDETGHIMDDEKDSLDADALLKSIQDGTEAANEERESRGWAPLHVLGWAQEPHYDPTSHNLVWGTRAESENLLIINHNTRVLGRQGMMSVTLVCDPEDFDLAHARAAEILSGLSYKPGNRYSEYIAGTDKVAEYGLTALIAGGAGAAAVKLGLFGKLWKALLGSLKLVLVGLLALAGALKRLLFGKKSAEI